MYKFLFPEHTRGLHRNKIQICIIFECDYKIQNGASKLILQQVTNGIQKTLQS